jgi:hypothetical protein
MSRCKFHAENLPTASVPDSLAGTHSKLHHPIAFEQTQRKSIRIVTYILLLTN